ncbi:MAG: PP2C family protein-serine/threonine phosphatase [Candidatus Geothermincolia bacterium]
MKEESLFARYRMTAMFTAIGALANVAYMLNSYIAHRASFSEHLGNNLFDHAIILFLVPLLFVVGYLADRAGYDRLRMEKALERERGIARSLELVFFPQARGIEGYDLATRYESLFTESSLGGDFYDIFRAGRGKTAVIMADVSGKGLDASVMGAFSKSVTRAFLRGDGDLSQAAAMINRAIYRETSPDIFVTAFIGLLEQESGLLRFVNAGHPGAIHYVEGRHPDPIAYAEDPPLGVFLEQGFAEHQLTLRPGDALALYTDGLYEFRNHPCSPEELAAEVDATHTEAADAIAQRMLDNGRSHEGAFDDDVAILVIKRTPASDEIGG